MNKVQLKKIIYFVIPLMLSNLLQVTYSAADTIIVGLSGEPDAVGAIGTTTAMINLVINIMIGCSVGAKVVISNAIGTRDKSKAECAVRTAVALSIALGVLCTVVGIALSRPVLRAMKNSSGLLLLAEKYAMIYFSGGIFISVTNFASAIFHAKADTKTPLKIILFSGLVNVLLNLFFVLVCRMSVEGVALATVISNALSAIIMLARLMKSKDMCGVNLKKIGFERTALLRMLRCGIPAGVQSALFSISHILIQASIVSVNNIVTPSGSEYAPIVKGCAASASIEGFGSTAINAISQAAITFTGVNVGAKKYDKIKSVQYSCYLTVFIVAVGFSMVVFSAKELVMALYGITRGSVGSVEELAYNACMIRMLYMFIPYFLLGFMEVGSGIMQGLGNSFTAMAVSVFGSVVFRIIWILSIFNPNPSLERIFISFPLSWLMTAALHFIFIKRSVNKNLQKSD